MSAIRWPAEFEPAGAPVHTHNVLEVDASPERLWAWLVRAPLWPTWYPNCRGLRIRSGPGPDLGPGTRFTWWTLGVRVDTTVREFEPPYRLAWSGTTLGGRGYHAWLIEPVDGTVRVVTDEVQRGALPSAGRVVLRRMISRAHDVWLARLAAVARTGPPPLA